MSNAAASSSSPTPAGRGKRRSTQPQNTEGLTDLSVPEPVDSHSSDESRRIDGLGELSATKPVSSRKSRPRPTSMIDQMRSTAKLARQSRFSEPNMSPVTRGQFSTPMSYNPDRLDTDEATLAAAPPPSVSQFSPRRSRADNVISPLSRGGGSRQDLPEEIENPLHSGFTTQLYIVSYLIFFSIFGTLARIGLKKLTFFEGAPANIPVLWANFAGTLILGFLLEDRNLFLDGWGHYTHPLSLEKAREEHLSIKKTVPLYIGLATGFCGSFTSFSSFMLDAFLSISNNLPTPINHPYAPGYTVPSTFTTVHRKAGYAIAALLATVILHTAISLSALKVGAHLALSLDGYIPSIPFKFLRSLLDRLIVPLAFLTWLGALLLTIFPPDRPGGPQGKASWNDESWRGTALISLVLAPLGCLLRYFLALKLNSVTPYFPLGTFTANIFGTAVLAMAYDLQHAPLGQGMTAGIGGGIIGCQVLEGVIDGFCGATTTVSTWCAEMITLKRKGYMYGGSTIVAGLCVMIIICGSARWSVGFDEGVCYT
jgi:CrcB protein